MQKFGRLINITELKKGVNEVIITVFKDGHVGIYTKIDGIERCTVTSEVNPNAAHIAEAWYSSLGFEKNQSNRKKLPDEFKELEKKYGYLYAYSAYKYLTNFKNAMER